MENLTKLIQIESRINQLEPQREAITESIRELESQIEIFKTLQDEILQELVELNQEKMTQGKQYLRISQEIGLGKNPNSEITKTSEEIHKEWQTKAMEKRENGKRSLLSPFTRKN